MHPQALPVRDLHSRQRAAGSGGFLSRDHSSLQVLPDDQRLATAKIEASSIDVRTPNRLSAALNDSSEAKYYLRGTKPSESLVARRAVAQKIEISPISIEHQTPPISLEPRAGFEESMLVSKPLQTNSKHAGESRGASARQDDLLEKRTDSILQRRTSQAPVSSEPHNSQAVASKSSSRFNRHMARKR